MIAKFGWDVSTAVDRVHGRFATRGEKFDSVEMGVEEGVHLEEFVEEVAARDICQRQIKGVAAVTVEGQLY